MKRFFLLPALILLIIHSCTLKQEATFNKNWSGEMRGTIDMREMFTIFSEGDQNFSILKEEDTQKKLAALKATPGIKKVKIKETEKGVCEFSFQFKDLKALNQSGNILFSDEKSPQNFTYFDLKDPKTLYFSMPFGDNYATEAKESEDDSMAENFAYELVLKFPKKVKSIETLNGAVLSDDKTKVILKSDILTMTSKGFLPGMVINFER